VCAAAGGLNLVMTAIALGLPESAAQPRPGGHTLAELVEWRVLAASITLFLYTFGYGGVTSFAALYADALGIAPKEIYFTTFASVILLTRPFAGRLADRVGHTRVLLPCPALISVGFVLLALARNRASFIASGVVFGARLRHRIHRVRGLRDAAR
jgi:nitrate/nitrite transporter NarK